MDPREEARAAFARRDWEAAHAAFLTLDERDADDLDALAETAHWLGRAEEVIDASSEAYRLHLEHGAPGKAALSAFMLAIYLRLRGDQARADGWQARAMRLLLTAPDGPEHGYPWYLEIAALMGVDLAAAVDLSRQMQELGRRHHDDTLVALGTYFEGRALVKQARVADGMALLDEAMLAALSDQLQPMWTGAIFCGLLDTCHELVDHRRASEWTEATRRWCEPLPVASLYPGICRVHHATNLHVHGSWEQAESEALAVCADMAGIDVFVVADGWYAIGEIRRRRGDLVGADEAYTRAHAQGRDPQPGVALLRLAQGRAEVASTSITSALAAFGGSELERAPLLIAEVDIALAVGNLDRAAAAAAAVDHTASTYESIGLAACARSCLGAVAVARGDAVAALGLLRDAIARWQDLDAPYESARARVQLARAYEMLGDRDATARERGAARTCFETLGAAADLRALGSPLESIGGLSPREVEVLRVVAQGETNRAIAERLFISEKTVARHLSNIFTKLEVSSRSEATAYAFAHGIAEVRAP
jgi:DNA-binding CsgD family transcriptional regulator